MSKRVEIRIKDMKFFVVGEDDASYIKSLAGQFNSRISNMERSNYRLNLLEATILASLNILDELEKEKKSTADLKNTSDDKAQVLEKIEELSNLKKKIEEITKDYKKTTNELEDLRKKFNRSNEELKDKVTDNFAKNDKIKALKAEVTELQEENSNLRNKNQEAQKKIIDLSRELESLYDEK